MGLAPNSRKPPDLTSDHQLLSDNSNTEFKICLITATVPSETEDLFQQSFMDTVFLPKWTMQFFVTWATTKYSNPKDGRMTRTMSATGVMSIQSVWKFSASDTAINQSHPYTTHIC